MLSDKDQKREFKKIVSKNYEKYYPVKYLQNNGFKRKQCKCGNYFWSLDSDVCGDPNCSGGFRFIGKNVTKSNLDYLDVWKKFSKMFEDYNYKSINRYPVVSRWNPTTDFTIASIAAFQPFVISGEVKPPAEKLVIPQFCLRFNDVDNVGITGHNVGFVMIGQHVFVDKNKWDQEKYFSEIHSWLNKGLGLKNKDIIFHEDAWAGGGNFGPCMEFFSHGLELGNQVYMMYEQTNEGAKELPIKVLDMGMGQERISWFSQGSSTNYDSTFPNVCKYLYKETGLKVDKNLMKKFVPLAGKLNVDEVKDVNKAWHELSNKLGVLDLKEEILPLSGLYSIGEHTRSLLVALNDGALPSNVGGGYNLRILARRCFGFIDKYKWDLDFFKLFELHANYLEPQYPELKNNLDDVNKILDVEREKYNSNKKKAKSIVEKIVKLKQEISHEKLIQLYDSDGINPYLIKDELSKVDVKLNVPDNFYSLISERHENKGQEHATVTDKCLKVSIPEDLEETDLLYYKDYKLSKFKAKVLYFCEVNDLGYLVLDKTCFYPTSGGQLHDLGKINNKEVLDVFKCKNYVIHEVKGKFKKGDLVEGEIDLNRRIQLAQHHTATHIVNAAAKKVLGNHVNQAGAKKTFEKAHIDLTHFSNLSDNELNLIEEEANKIIRDKVDIKKSFMSRDDAEKKYGFGIYQGGVPIGKELRIVDISDIDVECCGGTHLNNTSEAEFIKILKSSKISDSIIRIEFVAGGRGFEENKKDDDMVSQLKRLLNCNKNQIPGRVEELFILWKNVVKKKRKVDFKLESLEKFEGDIITKSSEILKTQPEYLVKTVERFLKDIKNS